ncbi:hypothetical protein HZB03_05870 [Candidatus Woesearchaeota archaeon]|nr:hypothetical protein [Candidatus Woesearchaeota archaeon]
MANTLKERILAKLADDPSKLYSIKDLAKTLNSAYSHTHLFVQQLAKDRIVTIQKVGNVSIVKLNPAEPRTLASLALISYQKTAEWQQKDARAQKIMERLLVVSDNIHCALIKSNKIILVVPENVGGVDFGIFQNRSVINAAEFVKNKTYYQDCVVLHGAEKYWEILLGSTQ